MSETEEVQPILERSENVKEELGTQSFLAFVPGAVAILLGGLLVYYRGLLIGLGWVLMVLGVGLLGFAVWKLRRFSKVKEFPLVCPFCQATNIFTLEPMEDVRCSECSRMVPIIDGRILEVQQVQCGFCKHLNYYSEKSTGLICENCDAVIPIATDEGPEALATFEKFTRRDDTNPYNLLLMSGDAKSEKLISTLQRILALNRNQVKEILEDTPALLLSGVPRKKAELLAADIEAAGGTASYIVSEGGQ